MVDEEEFRKKIMELAAKAALASVPGLGSTNLFSHPIEGMIAMSMAERCKERMKQAQSGGTAPQTKTTMGGFASPNNVQTNTPLNNSIDPLKSQVTKMHLENPITKLTDKVKQGYPKPRELSQIPMEIKDPNQWHIDSAPLPVIKNRRKTFAEKVSAPIKNEINKYKGLSPTETIQKIGSKIPTGVPIAPIPKDYYGISTKIADNEGVSIRAQKQNTFYKLKDIKDPEIAKNLREKMAKSKRLDINNHDDLEKIQNSIIAEPKSESSLYKYVKNSDITQKWIAENYNKLKNGTIKETDKGILYPKEMDTPEKRALYLTIHNADLKNTKLNKDGSIEFRLNDIFDFDAMDYQDSKTAQSAKELASIMKHNVVTKINNNAYSQQKKGKLEPYGLTMPIHYTPEEIEEILKKYGYR